jgi:hypothetical protein
MGDAPFHYSGPHHASSVVQYQYKVKYVRGFSLASNEPPSRQGRQEGRREKGFFAFLGVLGGLAV